MAWSHTFRDSRAGQPDLGGKQPDLGRLGPAVPGADNTGGQGLKEQMAACRVVAPGCLATGASSALILYKGTHKNG